MIKAILVFMFLIFPLSVTVGILLGAAIADSKLPIHERAFTGRSLVFAILISLFFLFGGSVIFHLISPGYDYAFLVLTTVVAIWAYWRYLTASYD